MPGHGRLAPTLHDENAWPFLSPMGLDRSQVFAYARPEVPSSDRALALAVAKEDETLTRPFLGRMQVTLLHRSEEAHRYLLRRDLEALGLDEDAAFALGIANLETFVGHGKVRLEPRGPGFSLLAGEGFESSLLLLPELWHWLSELLDTHEIVVATPTPELLLVVSASGAAGRADVVELRELARRLGEGRPAADELYAWRTGSWRVLTLFT